MTDSLIYTNRTSLVEVKQIVLWSIEINGGLLCYPSNWFQEQKKKYQIEIKSSEKCLSWIVFYLQSEKKWQKYSKVNVINLKNYKIYNIFSLVIPSLIKLISICQHPIWDSSYHEQSKAW